MRLTKKLATEATCFTAFPWRARFDAGDVSFRHLPITRQPKEQRHVDADAFADELLDGGQPFGRRRDLDEDVGPVQRGP